MSGSGEHARGDWIDGEWDVTGHRMVIDDIDQAEQPEQPDLVETLGMYLRAERERRLIGLDQLETTTCIRAAQLRAIEDDRFDDLPAEAYARGFVRTYAEQLGLEPEGVVDRFNRQWTQTHDDAGEAPFERRAVPIDVSARPPGRLALLLAALLLAASLVVVIVRSHSGGSAGAADPGPRPPARSATQPPASSAAATSGHQMAGPSLVRLTLTASSGACWYQARRGSAAGPVVAERTLAAGQTAHLHGRRLWLRLGDAASAQLRANGRPVQLAAVAGPVNLLLTPGRVTRL